MVVSSHYEAGSLRPIPVASIVRVLTSACIFLSVTLIGLLPNIRSIKALLDSGASLNLIHEELVAALGLPTQPCAPMYVTIANGSKLHHANRVVTLKFTLAGVQHEETFLVAPLGSNQLILGMPWLERVNPEIDWKLRTLTYRVPQTLSASHKPSPPTTNHAPTLRPTVIEREPSPSIPNHASGPRPVSVEDEPCPQDTQPTIQTPTPTIQTPNADPIPTSKPTKKKVRMAGPCTKVPYRRPTPKTSSYKKYPILISMTKRIATGDLVSLVFIQPLSPAAVNALGSDSIKLSTPEIPDCYKDLSDVFSKKESQSLPPHRDHLDHHIPLEKDAKPTFGPIYNLSELELKVLKEYIQDNLKKGFIRPSTSPFGSPVLFVKKPDGSLRLCVDYRALNRMTIKNRYPIPLTTEIMDRIKGAKRFTRLDVRDAFNRIRVAKGDEYKTAFRTRYGHFEYLVMPFGLCNAPATFQSYINDALHEFLDEFCVAYLDDVLIYTDGSLEDHINHVRQVLQRLLDNGLYVKLEKCEFHVQETKFLGFIISPNGIAMDPDRIATIVDWPTPKSQHDILVFLGFANFYRRFVEAYSRVVLPLTNLLRKSQRFLWTKPAQEAFDTLKTLFTDAPILKHFDPDLPITLHTDSSGAAISGIISQPHNDVLHPVAFWSRKCLPAECNYDIHDREMLAIIESMKHWRHYFEGAKYPIQIYSDHKNLETFMTTKILNRRQARWAEFLANYDFVLVHIPGKKNPADGPSRRPDYMENVEIPTGTLIPKSALRMLQPHELLPRTTSDGSNSQSSSSINQLSTLSPLEAHWNRIGVHANTVPDSSLRSRFITALETDPLAKQYRDNPPHPWSWQDDLLLHDNLIYIPDDLRIELMQMHHDDPLAGHYGVAKTIELLLRNYYFPGIHAYVKKYVSTCDLCSRGKTPRHLKHGELAPLPVPAGPWKGITCDLIVDLPISNGYDCIFVFIDRFTKMCHLIPCTKSTTSPQFAKMFLDHIIRLHGIPDSIVSDRGSIFTSHFWKALSKFLNLDKRLSTSFHPQTDGQTERMNQIVEQYLRIHCNYQQDNWSNLLSLAEFSYNNAQHSTIGCSPFYANYGYNPQFSVDIRQFSKYPVPAAKEMADRLKTLHEDLSELIKVAQNQQAKYYDAKHKRVEYQVGDKVWLLSQNIHTERPNKKLDWKRFGPYPIIERIGTQAYKLQLSPSMKIHPVFHVSLLERFIESDIPGRIQPTPPPVIIKNQVEYEVEDILDSKILRKRLFYLIKWKGYPISDNSWEPAYHLLNSKELIQEFHSQYPDKPSAPLPSIPTATTPKKKRGRPKKVNFAGTCFTFYLPNSPLSASSGLTIASACV